jgi:uncharacterized protein with von Willebrand factor type A (vWA) domain
MDMKKVIFDHYSQNSYLSYELDKQRDEVQQWVKDLFHSLYRGAPHPDQSVNDLVLLQQYKNLTKGDPYFSIAMTQTIWSHVKTELQKSSTDEDGSLQCDAARIAMKLDDGDVGEKIQKVASALQYSRDGEGGEGQGVPVDHAKMQKYMERLTNDPWFAKVIEIMGGLISSFNDAIRKEVIPDHAHIAGVEIGNKLTMLLKSEMAYLADDDFNDLSMLKFVTKTMLQFKCEKEKPSDKGPIAILLDKSGSMSNPPVKETGLPEACITYATGIAMAIVKLCEQQGRKTRLFEFDYRTQEVKYDNFIDLCLKLNPVANGGTLLAPALQRSLYKVREDNAKGFDWCVITDALDSPTESELKRLKIDKEEVGFKCHMFHLCNGMSMLDSPWLPYFDTITPVDDKKSMTRFLTHSVL